jgi:hypothetical protein
MKPVSEEWAMFRIKHVHPATSAVILDAMKISFYAGYLVYMNGLRKSFDTGERPEIAADQMADRYKECVKFLKERSSHGRSPNV